MKIVLGAHVVCLSDSKDNLELKTKIDHRIIVMSNDICYNNYSYGGVKNNHDS